MALRGFGVVPRWIWIVSGSVLGSIGLDLGVILDGSGGVSGMFWDDSMWLRLILGWFWGVLG